MISIVVAYTANRVIGREGELPWRLPGDMRHFRELTTGATVLMGRRTYESLPPAFRPLPQRRNLVLSARAGYEAPGAELFGSVGDALTACDHECFVIGGAVTYVELLPLCERIHATEIEAELDGDTLFPELPPAEWRLAESAAPLQENGLTYSFRTYERARPAL